MLRRTRITALGAALGLCVGSLGLVVPTSPRAQAPAARTCKMDPIKQSICIYQAILDDVDRNYATRGGGGIARIVQNSTNSYAVHLLQEGREDVRTYEVKTSPGGKVTITGVTEKTLRH